MPQISAACLRDSWEAKIKWPLYPVTEIDDLCDDIRSFVPQLPDEISVATTCFSEQDAGFALNSEEMQKVRAVLY